MKNQKLHLFQFIFFIFSFFMFGTTYSLAQPGRGIAKRIVKQKIKEKHADPAIEEAREKGREGIKDVTYRDQSSVIAKNLRSTGTLIIESTSYKKNGKISSQTSTKIEASQQGESFTSLDHKENTSRILFLYDDNAHYVIDEQNKTAMKMPLKHILKGMQRGIEKKYEKELKGVYREDGYWEATNKSKTISGYACKEYVYTNEKEKTRMHFWVAPNIFNPPFNIHTIAPTPNFIENIQKNSQIKTVDFPKDGTVIQALFYKKDKLESSYLLKEYSKASDNNSFKIEGYKINDIIDGL